ncbi:tetratricopeptide repeat protein [Sphingomonas sp. GlSt437]|uniref:tetratricopeptide repeat protein n=1 Tax=Sphingomonas sp. GlSt437 TaxID=3389970 RepID=UPI003A85C2F5
MKFQPSVSMGAVLVAVMSPPAHAAQTSDPTGAATAETLDKAYVEIKTGNPQKAIDLVEPIIKSNDQLIASEQRHVYCGMSPAETLFYLVQAANAKQGAIAYAKAACEALFVKAFALVDLNRIDDAQLIFKRLVQLAPQHSQYWAELGNTYRLNKNWDAGLEAYVQATESAALAEPQDKPGRTCIALRGQGYVLVELGRWDEAERAYRQCLKVIPNEPKSLGELHYIAQHRPK